MGFIYSIQICEISHQTFGPSHQKCPTCPMIFVNTVHVLSIFDGKYLGSLNGPSGWVLRSPGWLIGCLGRPCDFLFCTLDALLFFIKLGSSKLQFYKYVLIIALPFLTILMFHMVSKQLVTLNAWILKFLLSGNTKMQLTERVHGKQ